MFQPEFKTGVVNAVTMSDGECDWEQSYICLKPATRKCVEAEPLLSGSGGPSLLGPGLAVVGVLVGVALMVVRMFKGKKVDEEEQLNVEV